MSPKRLQEPGIKSSAGRVAIDYLPAHPDATTRTVQKERQPPQG